jgi:hypothetical protein
MLRSFDHLAARWLGTSPSFLLHGAYFSIGSRHAPGDSAEQDQGGNEHGQGENLVSQDQRGVVEPFAEEDNPKQTASGYRGQADFSRRVVSTMSTTSGTVSTRAQSR